MQDTVQNKVALTLIIQKVTSETSILTREAEGVGGRSVYDAIREDSLQNTISMTSDEKTSEYNQSEEASNTEDETPVPEVAADQHVVQPGTDPDLLSLVVEQTIPLRLDLASGEMVPDIEAVRKMAATDRGGE